VFGFDLLRAAFRCGMDFMSIFPFAQPVCAALGNFLPCVGLARGGRFVVEGHRLVRRRLMLTRACAAAHDEVVSLA
jgi:hypothetical protein